MIINETYTCEYCGEVFYTSSDCEWHELLCECQTKMKGDSTFVVKFFGGDGNEIQVNFSYCPIDQITAVYASTEDAIDWVTRFYEFVGYYGPWLDDSRTPGLRVFEEGKTNWVSPTEVLERMNSYLNKYKVAD